MIHSLQTQDFEYCLLNISRFSVFGENKESSGTFFQKNDNSINIKKLIDQLAAGDTELVITDLLNNSSLKAYTSEIVGISARYNHEKKAWHQGILDRDSFGQGLNRINQTLIDLINKIIA